jgi:hypothetical protein
MNVTAWALQQAGGEATGKPGGAFDYWGPFSATGSAS